MGNCASRSSRNKAKPQNKVPTQSDDLLYSRQHKKSPASFKSSPSSNSNRPKIHTVRPKAPSRQTERADLTVQKALPPPVQLTDIVAPKEAMRSNDSSRVRNLDNEASPQSPNINHENRKFVRDPTKVVEALKELPSTMTVGNINPPKNISASGGWHHYLDSRGPIGYAAID